jgi:hypothetical protein
MRLIPRIWHGEIFNAAYVRWSFSPDQTNSQRALVSVAPYVLDLVLVVIGMILPASFFLSSRVWKWLGGLMLVFLPWLNTLLNYIPTFFTHTDISDVAKVFGIHLPWPFLD